MLGKKILLTVFAVTVFSSVSFGKSDQRIDDSLVKKSRASLEKGSQFLLKQQKDDGSWLHEAAVTGLAVIALHESGDISNNDDIKKAIEKGRKFILDNVRENGAIAGSKSKYVNYTTSICLETLGVLNRPEDRDVILDAREFLISFQLDEDHPEHPTSKDNQYYGGIGYGSAGPKHPDLSNTQWALEALYSTRDLVKDTEHQQESELAWDRAKDFLKAVQNVPEDADETWVVSKREKDNMDGGFIYKPDASKVNEKLRKQGEEVQGLRSYGSMTYAGLKSMIYADLDKEDFRVKAAVDWARKHYTLEENPILGAEGYYYYLQTFAKAMDAYGRDVLKTPDGTAHEWREDLLTKLIELQGVKGQWLNKRSGRWMESLPELVTSYAMIAMEVALDDRLSD